MTTRNVRRVKVPKPSKMLVQTFRRFDLMLVSIIVAYPRYTTLVLTIYWIGNLAMQILGYGIYRNMRHIVHTQRAFLLRIALTIA